MKYVCHERFTDDLGFTFEKWHSGGYGKPHVTMFVMRKDNSQNVFETIEKEQYDTAYRQWKQDFLIQLREKDGITEEAETA
ncbi:MAG: hypothetical protein FWB73_00495 [Treponema sp.]|nr:hypothetical protein [Treponema sp.]